MSLNSMLTFSFSLCHNYCEPTTVWDTLTEQVRQCDVITWTGRQHKITAEQRGSCFTCSVTTWTSGSSAAAQGWVWRSLKAFSILTFTYGNELIRVCSFRAVCLKQPMPLCDNWEGDDWMCSLFKAFLFPNITKDFPRKPPTCWWQ